MNVFDLHHTSKAVNALNSQAISSDTTTVGNTVDRAGFTALEFVFLTKTLTDGDYAIDLYDDDASGMGTEVIVSDAEMLGDINISDDTDDNAGVFTNMYVDASSILNVGSIRSGIYQFDGDYDQPQCFDYPFTGQQITNLFNGFSEDYGKTQL